MARIECFMWLSFAQKRAWIERDAWLVRLHFTSRAIEAHFECHHVINVYISRTHRRLTIAVSPSARRFTLLCWHKVFAGSSTRTSTALSHRGVIYLNYVIGVAVILVIQTISRGLRPMDIVLWGLNVCVCGPSTRNLIENKNNAHQSSRAWAPAIS